MGVIVSGDRCGRCSSFCTRRIDEPFCWNCMEEIRVEKIKAKWDYPPDYVDDEELWRKACKEIEIFKIE